MKKFFTISLVAAILSAIAIYRMDGFSAEYLPQLEECNHFHHNSSDLDESIWKQKFHYLASGRQSFAFESEDKMWVLKIINQSRFILSPFLQKISYPPSLCRFLKEKEKKRKGRVSAFFRSFSLAYKKMRKETALEFIHFSKEKAPLVTITTPVHYPVELDLSSCWFVLQRKGESFATMLQKEKENPQNWKNLLSSFFKLVVERTKKGIIDDDLNVMGNVAFIGRRAFLIDPGRLFEEKKSTKNEVKEELRKSSKQLKQWIKKNQPALLPIFEEEYLKTVNAL